jgi:hypothetical protein
MGDGPAGGRREVHTQRATVPVCATVSVVFAPTRTDVPAEDFRAGSSRERLAALYELTAEQVDQALRFELISSRELVA